MPLSLQHYVQIVATKNTVTRQGRAATIAVITMFDLLFRRNKYYSNKLSNKCK